MMQVVQRPPCAPPQANATGMFARCYAADFPLSHTLRFQRIITSMDSAFGSQEPFAVPLIRGLPACFEYILRSLTLMRKDGQKHW